MFRINKKYFSVIKDMPLSIFSHNINETSYTLGDYINDIGGISSPKIAYFMIVSGHKIHIYDKNDKLIDFFFYDEVEFPTNKILTKLTYLKRKEIINSII